MVEKVVRLTVSFKVSPEQMNAFKTIARDNDRKFSGRNPAHWATNGL